jgi:hypothetical protein
MRESLGDFLGGTCRSYIEKIYFSGNLIPSPENAIGILEGTMREKSSGNCRGIACRNRGVYE